MSNEETNSDTENIPIVKKIVKRKPASKKVVAKKVVAKKVVAKKVVAKKVGKQAKVVNQNNVGNSNYPRHSIEKSLRIPKVIIEQNAAKATSALDAAKFLNLSTAKGPFSLEVSSSLKYGFLERASGSSLIQPTELAKRILRPQSPEDELKGLREAVLKAPVISEVYKHYRGENLPDDLFFRNALSDNFSIPSEKVNEFIEVFKDSLSKAKLIEKIGDKQRILDISTEINSSSINTSLELKKLSKAATFLSTDTCFVMMPFAQPLGGYFTKIFEPAIEKAGLKAVRADDDIFGTGKIIDQIWSGINSAKVLVAELTSRNPNVYYELGLAHALKKPVVLVCSNEQDVPFDLKHIRVIYYDMHDPFWGTKLIEKVAENILSAISNPTETILFN